MNIRRRAIVRFELTVFRFLWCTCSKFSPSKDLGTPRVLHESPASCPTFTKALQVAELHSRGAVPLPKHGQTSPH